MIFISVARQPVAAGRSTILPARGMSPSIASLKLLDCQRYSHHRQAQDQAAQKVRKNTKIPPPRTIQSKLPIRPHFLLPSPALSLPARLGLYFSTPWFTIPTRS